MARESKSYVTLSGYEVIRCTDAAVCISKAGTNTWLPRTYVQDGDALDKGDTDLAVARWLAEKEDLDTD